MTREEAKEKALAAVVTRYQEEIASLKQSLAEAEGQIRHLEQRISGLGKIANADRAMQTAAEFWNEMILKHFRQREDRPGYEIDWNEIGEALAKALLAAEERGAAGLGTAVAEFDARMDDIGSCGDGNCLVKKQGGMHTNGGCRCWHDKMISQRFMLATRRLRNALPPTPEPEETGDG
jgi:hypothetical protein